MTLFPSVGLFDDRDKSLQNQLEHTYREAITLNLAYWAEADTDTRFYSGDQTLWNDLYGNIPSFRRKSFNFNRIRRIVNMITGYQRQHQKSIEYVPREQEDQQTSDQMTKLAFWAESVASVNKNISDAFEGSVVTGQTLLHLWWDFRQDPINGDPQIDVLQYNDFIIDPYYRKQDLSDCNYIWRRKYMNNKEIASLLPEYADEIMRMQGQGGTSDGKFYFQPETYNYGYADFLTYDEYYYRTYRKGQMIVDTQSGDSLEWPGDENSMKEFLNAFPQLEVVDQVIPTVQLAILVNGKTFYHGKGHFGDCYPFVPFWCYYEPQLPYFPWRVQGVVRDLRDSQYLYNRRKVIELDILESTINQGWMMEEGALVDPESIYQTSQGRQIVLKKGKQPGVHIQRIDPPQVPPSMIELSKILGDEISQISGVNEELLGTAEDDKAGILSMLRQGAGLVTLQKIFDQLDYSIKMVGKLLMIGFQHNLTPGKVRRIINEEPSSQFFDRYFGKFDVSVQEGSYSTTQKQLSLKQKLYFREIGIPIPTASILEDAQIQGKNELIQQIQAEEQQQQQMAMQQSQIQMGVTDAQMQSLLSKAEADRGLAIERASRVEENQMLAYERLQEGQKDRSQAALDQMRAIKELQGMDLEYVQKALGIIDMLQRNETVGGQQEFEYSKMENKPR
ncbi:MAG: hypothetical protein PVF17_00450 [Ignavibacteria bacterium]|jgi:hypothetical protein